MKQKPSSIRNLVLLSLLFSSLALINMAAAQSRGGGYMSAASPTLPDVAGAVGCECLDDAYTADGNVRYRCRIQVQNNPASQTKVLLTQNPAWSQQGGATVGPFWIANGNITYPASGSVNGVQCGPNDLFGKKLNPGEKWNTCIEVTVPSNVNSVNAETYGVFDAPSGSNPQQDADIEGFALNFPETCASRKCERGEAALDGQSQSINTYTDNGGGLRIALSDILKIPGNPDLTQLSAEIAYFKHITADECRACSSGNEDLAFFSPTLAIPGMLLNANGWANPKGSHSAPTSAGQNQLVWTPAPPAIGAKLRPNGQQVRLFIDIPDAVWSACCENEYKVCIRYTYTDEECDSCDALVCHDVSLSEPPEVSRPSDPLGPPVRRPRRGEIEIAPGIFIPRDDGTKKRGAAVDGDDGARVRLANAGPEAPICKRKSPVVRGGGE